jgi:hypothetical protein
MRWPPDRSPANARKLGGRTCEETECVVAYEAEVGVEGDIPPRLSDLSQTKKPPEMAPDPSMGSGAAMGRQSQAS